MTKEKTNITCSFTGHRPEKLTLSESDVIEWLEKQIRNAIKDGYVNFISGMQRGVDIWAAESVLKIRNEGAPIKLICACAWNGMEELWEQSWIDRYNTILQSADTIQYVCENPGRKAFFERNKWMVEHAACLIGVYNNAPGGTKHTIDYAQKKELKIKVITDEL